jgi:acyl-CoA synthetase (AMP-forming)/AMP-acid ligase II
MISETMGELYDYSCRYFRHQTAIVYGDQRFTFNQLKENSLRLANSLLQLGMHKGDKVGVLMSNCPGVYIYRLCLLQSRNSRVRLATFLKLTI